MLTEVQVHQFRRDGFLNYGRVLTEEQLTGLREALDRVLTGRSAASPDAAKTSGTLPRHHPGCQRLGSGAGLREHLFNPVIVPMMAQLMGTDTVRVWHDQMQLKPPRIGGPTLWHQDHPYWPIIQPADLVSAWVALEDATVENGAMSMVPGSHKWGNCHAGKGRSARIGKRTARTPTQAWSRPARRSSHRL